jgi:hypothetical protein
MVNAMRTKQDRNVAEQRQTIENIIAGFDDRRLVLYDGVVGATDFGDNLYGVLYSENRRVIDTTRSPVATSGRLLRNGVRGTIVSTIYEPFDSAEMPVGYTSRLPTGRFSYTIIPAEAVPDAAAVRRGRRTRQQGSTYNGIVLDCRGDDDLTVRGALPGITGVIVDKQDNLERLDAKVEALRNRYV